MYHSSLQLNGFKPVQNKTGLKISMYCNILGKVKGTQYKLGYNFEKRYL